MGTLAPVLLLAWRLVAGCRECVTHLSSGRGVEAFLCTELGLVAPWGDGCVLALQTKGPCVGLAEAAGDVFVLVGGAHGGLCRWRPGSPRCARVAPLSHGRFLVSWPRGGPFWVGRSEGLRVSPEGLRWHPVASFDGMDCRAACATESLLVVAADSLVFRATLASWPTFTGPHGAGFLANPALRELSGLAASATHPVLWAINDSGNPPHLYAVGPDGSDRGTFPVRGATLVDWEDLAVGFHRALGCWILYVADIGDNGKVRDFCTIYGVREPEVLGASGDSLQVVLRRNLVYPGGARYDAETLLYDPLAGDLFVVTKDPEEATVFRVPPGPDSLATMEPVAQLRSLGGPVVAGDVCASGLEVILKTYTQVLWWRRDPGQTLAEALAGAPTVLPYAVEPQGEAICWTADGMGYATASEQVGRLPVPLLRYQRAPWEVSDQRLWLVHLAPTPQGLWGVWPGEDPRAGLWFSPNGARWEQRVRALGLTCVAACDEGLAAGRAEGGVVVYGPDLSPTATLLLDIPVRGLAFEPGGRGLVVWTSQRIFRCRTPFEGSGG